MSAVCCRADHSSRGVPPSGVLECDREAAIMGRPCPTKGSRAIVKKRHARLLMWQNDRVNTDRHLAS